MFTIVVLSGGLATRLRPVTETIPKSIIPVNDIPFVLHQLELFEKKGFKKIHFCLGYLGEMVEELIKNSRYKDIFDISFSYDGNVLLGTGGAIKKVINYLPDYFFITYGDSYLDINYKDIECFFDSNRRNELTGLMTVFKNDGKWDKSNVIFDEKQILMYSKKVNNPQMQYIDYGVGILSKENFADYPDSAIFDLADIYEKLAIDNNLLGVEIFHRFFEIGSFKGIEDISNYLKNHK